MNLPLTPQQLAMRPAAASGEKIFAAGNQVIGALDRLDHDLLKLGSACQTLRILAEDILPVTPLEDELIAPEIVIPWLANELLACVKRCLISRQEIEDLLNQQGRRPA
jgi:hypothetical protein